MITQDELKVLLDYEEDKGIFRWKVSNNNRVKVGDIAGSLESKGYIVIGIKGRKYRAHRLAWLYVNGKILLEQIDHINHDKADNRISNLREVNVQDNIRNGAMGKNNTSGYKGVSWKKDISKWRVQIHIDGNKKLIGYFNCLMKAARAYDEVAKEAGYHDNHINFPVNGLGGQENTWKKRQSTSGYKGISWDRGIKKWRVQIKVGSKTKFLGSFNCLMKAVGVYEAEFIRISK